MSTLTRVLRAADEALGSKVPNELFFQYSTRLNKEATVNSLVGHAQAICIEAVSADPHTIDSDKRCEFCQSLA